MDRLAGEPPTAPALTDNFGGLDDILQIDTFVVGTCGALLLCGGTSGASSRAAAGHGPALHQNTVRHGWISPRAKKMKLIYVSDYTQSLILIYPQGGESSGPIGEIVNGISNPQGIAVDSAGTLYVANQGNNTITEYPFGATDPSVTLSNSIFSAARRVRR